MRRSIKRGILFTVLVGVTAAWTRYLYAQTTQNQIIPQTLQAPVLQQIPQFSIFDSFERRAKPGEGTVVVHQSEAIKRMIGARIDSENIDISNGKTYLITKGYRVQVYSGNNQRVSRKEAEELQKKIKESYPDIDTYVTYHAPFWKLLAGNYRSFEEAWVLLRDLRKTFPKKKNELDIIEDDIRLLLDNQDK
jgi:hypothetical protein